MNPLTGDVIVMPTWVFLFLLIGGMAIICFLLWANDTTRHDLRHERRRRAAHDHLHHDGPAPTGLLALVDEDPLEWTEAMSDRAIERMHTERKAGGSR